MSAFFLTGTDTEIGKTFSACALLHAWRATGLTAVGYKPVAAGAECLDGVWSNEDARRLHAASSAGFSLQDINPVCLRSAIAPHIASREEGQPLQMDKLLAGATALQRRADCLLVEGVGGFIVPLGKDFSSADLAVALRMPVILVVGLRLGCLNHAALSAEAILRRGLKLAGWIANSPTATPMAREAENLQSLAQLIDAPCLGHIPHDPDGAPERAAKALDTTLLDPIRTRRGDG